MSEINTGGAEQELIEQLQARIAELESGPTQWAYDQACRVIREDKEKIEQLESDLSGCIKLIAKYESER